MPDRVVLELDEPTAEEVALILDQSLRRATFSSPAIRQVVALLRLEAAKVRKRDAT